MTIAIKQSSIFYPAGAGGAFDGSTNYMSKSGSLVANTDKGICSFWFKSSSIASGATIIDTNISDIFTQAPPITFTYSGSSFQGSFVKVGSASLRSMTTNGSSYLDSKWHNILISWDRSGAGTSGTLVIDNVVKVNGTSSGVTVNAGAAPSAWVIAADRSGNNKANINISEFYLTTNTYLDFTVVANRRKFISATNRPIFLGSTGSLPTGSQPEMYFKGTGTGFNVNTGSAGNFTATGTIGTPSTTPST